MSKTSTNPNHMNTLRVAFECCCGRDGGQRAKHGGGLGALAALSSLPSRIFLLFFFLPCCIGGDGPSVTHSKRTAFGYLFDLVVFTDVSLVTAASEGLLKIMQSEKKCFSK